MSSAVGDHGDYFAMLRRMMRAAGRRVAAGDPADLAELLATLHELDGILAAAVEAQHAAGFSWAEIAGALGVSRQAVHKRWGRRSATVPATDVEVGEISR